MSKRNVAINRLRIEYRNLVAAMEGLAKAVNFEEEEENWKKFLHSFYTIVRSIRKFAELFANDQAFLEQTRDEVLSNSGSAHPALRYLIESRNNLVHHDEKGFVLPWVASDGLYTVGSFGFKYNPLIAGAEQGSLNIVDCYSA